MTIHRLGGDEFETVRPLIDADRFGAYRNYRAFSRPAQAEVLAAEIRTALEVPGTCAVAASTSEGSSAAVAQPLAWDTAFFGVPMARLVALLGDETGARRLSLTACLSELRRCGIRHVAARVDSADAATVALLQDHGFRLVGGMATYVARPRREPPRPLRALGTVRPFEEEDGPAVLTIAARAFKTARSRFHADPHLPRERVEAYYGEWAERCVSGALADMMFVSAGRMNKILGFLAFRKVEPISRVSGIAVYGGGLGACRPDASGAYSGLIAQGVRWSHDHRAIAEVQTQTDNWAAMAIFEATGLRLRRIEYNFHSWLD